MLSSFRMNQALAIFILLFAFSGCATAPKQAIEEAVLDLEAMPQNVEQPDPSTELQNIADEDLAGYVQKKGIVFAKTDFQGVLKTRYVRLVLEDMDNPTQQYQLHIGEKSAEQKFPWNVKAVEPGYFFVELPEGSYRIISVSIPVGSTMATEPIDIRFDVLPDEISYVGTLRMIGTKERIKLGGLPVIKPGFEYEVEVLNEQEEGIKAFRLRYPTVPNDILVNIMQLNILDIKR